MIQRWVSYLCRVDTGCLFPYVGWRVERLIWVGLVVDFFLLFSFNSFNFLLVWVWVVGPSALIGLGFLSSKGGRPGAQLDFLLLVKIESSPFSLLLWQTRGEAGGNISVEACRSDILQGAALSSYAPNALRAACRVGTLDGTTEFLLYGPGVAQQAPAGQGWTAYVAGKNYRSMAPSLSPNLSDSPRVRVRVWETELPTM